jgi:hypothetical protein
VNRVLNQELHSFEQCTIFAFIKHRFWGLISSMKTGQIDNSVDGERLENFGDLNKLEPVFARQAVIPFLRFWIFKSGPLVRMGVQDLYAENMRIPDMKKRYAQNSWPTIPEHEEYLKMQHEVASHMIAGIKSAIFLTASATVVGVLLAWFAGRLGHSLPFRLDITLQVAGATVMGLSGVLTFHKLPPTWDGDPLLYRVYQLLYVTTFLFGLPITILGQLLAQ